MYNQYALHCSTANSPHFLSSRVNSSSFVSVVSKPPFLIPGDSDPRKKGASSHPPSAFQLDNFALSDQLFSKLQRIDQNPFLRVREVHLKSHCWGQDLSNAPSFRTKLEEKTQETSICFSELMPTFAEVQRWPSIAEHLPATDHTERSTVIEQVTTKSERGEEARKHPAYEVQVTNFATNSSKTPEQFGGRVNRKGQTCAVPHQEDYEDIYSHQAVGYPSTFEPPRSSHRSKERKSISIINRLEEQEEERAKLPFVSSHVQEPEEDLLKCWGKRESEETYQGQWSPPPSICLKGVTYDFVPVS